MFEAILFYLLAALLVGLGLVVVTGSNPIASALALLGALGCLSGLYALLGAPVVAVVQVLVYAGGILVMMVFVLMTLRLGGAQLAAWRVRPFPLLLFLTASGAALAVPLLLRFAAVGRSTVPAAGPGAGTLEALASLIFGPWWFPFEMLSVVLLSAVVGAVVLSLRRL